MVVCKTAEEKDGFSAFIVSMLLKNNILAEKKPMISGGLETIIKWELIGWMEDQNREVFKLTLHTSVSFPPQSTWARVNSYISSWKSNTWSKRRAETISFMLTFMCICKFRSDYYNLNRNTLLFIMVGKMMIRWPGSLPNLFLIGYLKVFDCFIFKLCLNRQPFRKEKRYFWIESCSGK